jgi:hypothetical protein
MRPVNQIYGDYDEFVLSKASIEPLTTRQYLWPQGPMAGLVSCKMKTADHIVDHYGADAAGTKTECRALNRHTLKRVLDSIPTRKHQYFALAPDKIVFEQDIPARNGPHWLEPYEAVRWADDGTLHVQSKGAYVGWTDPKYAEMPARFRGARYCHAMTPDYFLSLLTEGQ